MLPNETTVWLDGSMTIHIDELALIVLNKGFFSMNETSDSYDQVFEVGSRSSTVDDLFV
jgi:hypothetical protein